MISNYPNESDSVDRNSICRQFSYVLATKCSNLGGILHTLGKFREITPNLFRKRDLQFWHIYSDLRTKIFDFGVYILYTEVGFGNYETQQMYNILKRCCRYLN